MITPSSSYLARYHNEVKNVFSPLPQDGKVLEVAKRIFILLLAPLAYVVLTPLALLGCIFTSNSDDGVYYARFINIQRKVPGFNDLRNAIVEDVNDYQKGYQKGTCLYTPSSIQPLAAFDPRHESGKQIAVEYPFALLIDPKVKLHYWSLQDMDRNISRGMHEDAAKTRVQKYKPDDDAYHTLFAKWKTVHFTGIDSFIEKIDTVAKAHLEGRQTYLTKGGKKKQIASLKKNHNEGSITYNPEKDVMGILIHNDPANIKLAEYFKENYQDNAGNFAFKNVFLAYQDGNGKIQKIA